MSNDVIKRATEYWSEKRLAQRLPVRDSLDLDHMSEYLPHLILSEAVDDGRDYRHELTGAEAERLLGGDLNGVWTAERAERQRAVAAWRSGLNVSRMFRAPHFATFAGPDGKSAVRAAFMPLAKDGGSADARYVLSALTAAEQD